MIWPGSSGWFALGISHAVAVGWDWAGVTWRLTGVGYPRWRTHMTGRWCLLRAQPGLLAGAPRHGFSLSLRLEGETSSQLRLLPELAQCHFYLFHCLKHMWNLLNFGGAKKAIPSFVGQVSRLWVVTISGKYSLLHWSLILFIKER